MNFVIKPANPQGKGLVPVLDSLQQTRKQLLVPAKNIQQISHELFTSLFILNSEIRFKPVCGRTYYLYHKNNHYRLSMIAPEQWSCSRFGRFIGACELQADLTWTLQLSEQCLQDQVIITEISRQREQFEQKMQQARQVDDMLPVYVGTLPFYSRVLASALAYSLAQSMQKSGIKGLSLSEAQNRLQISQQ